MSFLYENRGKNNTFLIVFAPYFFVLFNQSTVNSLAFSVLSQWLYFRLFAANLPLLHQQAILQRHFVKIIPK
jgi:hypothetical protein